MAIGWSWREPPRPRWSAPHLFDDWIESSVVAVEKRERNNTRDKGREREKGSAGIKGGGGSGGGPVERLMTHCVSRQEAIHSTPKS
jgi:hypothetical protein